MLKKIKTKQTLGFGLGDAGVVAYGPYCGSVEFVMRFSALVHSVLPSGGYDRARVVINAVF